MILLPVVERELRVAARRRSTYWFRTIPAILGLISGGIYMLLSAIWTRSSAGLGEPLFWFLMWASFWVVLAAGLVLTSDSISVEKREGTLGFLFLTDLRGLDVAAGKLFSTSLRASYALLSLFPVVALTLLLGGPSGMQLFKTSLALLNALFCSLAVGLLVSTLSYDSQRTMTGTLFLTLALVFGGPLLDSLVLFFKTGPTPPGFAATSPFTAFKLASAWIPAPFWKSLGISHLIGWLLFAAACWLVPRTWQAKSEKAVSQKRGWHYNLTYGGEERRLSLRRRLLSSDPVLWLVCRERWQSFGVWALALLVTAVQVYQFRDASNQFLVYAFSSLNTLCLLLFYFWTASQANRFFIEARRSGLIEMLLETPLPAADIIRGQWRAMLRMFALPMVLVVAGSAAGVCISQFTTWSTMAGNMGGKGASQWAAIGIAILGAVATLANLAAVAWYGMWAGLTSKNSSLATVKTLLLVQLIPWIVIMIASSMISAIVLMPIMRSNAGSTSPAWLASFPVIMAALSALLTLAKDALFILWARRRFSNSFRDQVLFSQTGLRSLNARIAPPVITPPPPLPQAS